MNQTDQCINGELLRKKLYVLQCTNMEKVEIFHVSHHTVALLMRRRSEQRTRNRYQRIFGKVWTIHIENVDQKTNFL